MGLYTNRTWRKGSETVPADGETQPTKTFRDGVRLFDPMEKNNPTPKESTQWIDPDKVAENPGLLPYASNVGGALIKAIDKGRVKGLSLDAMYEQTNVQLDQIRKQVELLAQQAQAVHRRVEISETIYRADMGFKPNIGHHYHLYRRKNGKHLVSMVAPEEWGPRPPYEFVASVKLLSDHTWEILAGTVAEE